MLESLLKRIQKKTEAVLVVEDDLNIRRLIDLHLRNAGYAVSVASNGEEALDVLDEGHRFDLLILDIFMPRMNGIEFAHEVRTRNEGADIPMIFVTGSNRHDQFDLIRKTFPGSLVFPKPFRAAEVLEAVKEQLALASKGRRRRK